MNLNQILKTFESKGIKHVWPNNRENDGILWFPRKSDARRAKDLLEGTGINASHVQPIPKTVNVYYRYQIKIQ